MSLKIFILPTFIILEVIIAIGYIKPNIDGILGKRDEIVAAKEGLTKVDSVIENIQSVGRSISSRAETVGFVNKYYPMKLDEERVVDMFNFLAQQSGILVTGVTVMKDPEIRVSDAAYNDAINLGLTPEEATMKAEAAAAAAPKSYTAKVTVIGAYSNIRDFFAKLHRSDRLHVTDEFGIEERKQDPNKAEEEAAVGIQSNFLIGTFKAKFPYVGEQRTSDALNDPLFQASAFNFKPTEEILSFVTNPLPMLESGQGGRENPFE